MIFANWVIIVLAIVIDLIMIYKYCKHYYHKKENINRIKKTVSLINLLLNVNVMNTVIFFACSEIGIGTFVLMLIFLSEVLLGAMIFLFMVLTYAGMKKGNKKLTYLMIALYLATMATVAIQYYNLGNIIG